MNHSFPINDEAFDAVKFIALVMLNIVNRLWVALEGNQFKK